MFRLGLRVYKNHIKVYKLLKLKSSFPQYSVLVKKVVKKRYYNKNSGLGLAWDRIEVS